MKLLPWACHGKGNLTCSALWADLDAKWMSGAAALEVGTGSGVRGVFEAVDLTWKFTSQEELCLISAMNKCFIH